MKLTKEEYTMFNLASRVSILDNEGILLFKKRVNKRFEIKLFLLYDFYVEVFYNRRRKAALRAEPLWRESLLQGFYV